MQVVASGKTPRGPSDRVKTKDAELLARLLLAGSLTEVVVPPPEVEAARELTRAHDTCRRDLMNARHRVSKMLLRHGRVYPKATTWTAQHRRWLSQQRFSEPVSDLVFADLIAAVDGLTARKASAVAAALRAGTDERWWPTAARLRAFRGIDTLTAFSLHLELGADWQRFSRATSLGSWLGLTPSLSQSGESSRQGHTSPRPARSLPGGCWSSRPGTTAARRASAPRWPTARGRGSRRPWRSSRCRRRQFASERFDLDRAGVALDDAVGLRRALAVRMCVSSGRESMKCAKAAALKQGPLSLTR